MAVRQKKCEIQGRSNASENEHEMIYKFGSQGIYALNHYSGCSFGCRYSLCGTTVTTRIRPQKVTRVLTDAISNIPEGELIWMGALVDPYQHLEREFKLTRTILEFFKEYTQYSLNILTISDLILRDLDLLKEVNLNRVYFGMFTLEEGWSKKLEPFAPTPSERIAAITALLKEGIRVTIRIHPYIPNITIIRDIVDTFSEYGDLISYEARPLHIFPELQTMYNDELGEQYTQDYILTEFEKAKLEHSDIANFKWRPYEQR